MSNSFNALSELKVDGKSYKYYSIKSLEKHGIDIKKLPNSLKVLTENLLRKEDGKTVKSEDILSMKKWIENGKSDQEINYYPARVLMQDFEIQRRLIHKYRLILSLITLLPLIILLARMLLRKM